VIFYRQLFDVPVVTRSPASVAQEIGLGQQVADVDELRRWFLLVSRAVAMLDDRAMADLCDCRAFLAGRGC
jgi:hypothetical protein